jgi:hypothetical protein
MTIDRIRDVWRAQPFRPFTIHMADGRRIPVHHRDLLMPSPSGRTVVVYQLDDALNIVDLLLVTDIEIAADGSSAGLSVDSSRKTT